MKVAILKSKKSSTVVRFIDKQKLNKKAKDAVWNDTYIGFYYTQSGNIRFMDVWGRTHKAE